MLRSERLNQWLRDAHAMETQAEQLLDGQARRSDRFPHLSTRLKEHLATTRLQRGRLEDCISRRGTTSSAIKDMAGKVTATMQNLSGIFVEDEIVKGVLAIYTFEQMSVASYEILEAAAIADGDQETAIQCALSRAEEEELCAWLRRNLREITTDYLSNREAA